MIKSAKNMFKIFVKPTTSFQPKKTSMLTFVIPHYLTTIKEQWEKEAYTNINFAIIKACNAAVNKPPQYLCFDTNQQFGLPLCKAQPKGGHVGSLRPMRFR